MELNLFKRFFFLTCTTYFIQLIWTHLVNLNFTCFSREFAFLSSNGQRFKLFHLFIKESAHYLENNFSDPRTNLQFNSEAHFIFTCYST